MSQFGKLLPACGFAIAVALVCVTSAYKDAPRNKGVDLLLTFQYMPPTSNPYSATSVQDVDNWEYTSNNARCSDDNEEACRIFVPDNPTYIGSGNTLKPAIGIVTGGSSSQAYVDHTAAGNGPDFVSNKSE